MINVNKRKNRWQIDFRYNNPVTGKRERFKRNAPPGHNKRQAHQWGMTQWEDVHTVPEQVMIVPDFETFSEKYLELAPSFLADSTVKIRRSRIRGVYVPYFGQMLLSEIDVLTMEEFIAVRLDGGEGVGNTTVKGDVAIISTMLGKAVEWNMLEAVPKFRRPKADEVDWTWLMSDECGVFLSACRREPLLQDLVAFALNTGLRQGELVGLRWRDIATRTKTMTVRTSRPYGKDGPPKGGKSRDIPLNDDAWQAIQARRASSFLRDGPVFCTEDGKHLDKMMLRTPWRRAVKASGLRWFTMHDLRHTFASHLVQKNISLAKVQKLLGHASITTTMRYAHLAPDDLRESVDALNSFGNRLGTKRQIA